MATPALWRTYHKLVCKECGCRGKEQISVTLNKQTGKEETLTITFFCGRKVHAHYVYGGGPVKGVIQHCRK